MREESDGKIDREVCVLCQSYINNCVAVRVKRVRTFIFRAEPTAADSQFDQIWTALEDVRQSLL